jgi:hypothetical protein
MWQREWQLHDIGENLITKRLVIFRITRFLKCVLLPHARKKYYFFFRECVNFQKFYLLFEYETTDKLRKPNGYKSNILSSKISGLN